MAETLVLCAAPRCRVVGRHRPDCSLVDDPQFQRRLAQRIERSRSLVVADVAGA